jgi:hypothetical protein
MIDIDFWELLTSEQVEEIQGICKVFTRDEPWKDPPRARVITWTYTVNLDMGMRVKFELFNQTHTRFLVHEGDYAACIDGKQAFNMFSYSIQVGMYHCVHTPLGWCRVKRTAMGARPSVFIADTALCVLAAPCKTTWKTYVDNLCFIGLRNMVREDLITVRERAEYAEYTFNEDLSDPDALIKQRLEFLGLMLNFKTKGASLADKVLKKLASVWIRQRLWSVRDFIVCVCVLVYTVNVLGRHPGKWQKVLQAWARAQSECMFDPKLMEAAVDLPVEIVHLLEDWVGVTLANEEVKVPKPQGKAHDFVEITDACVNGWCGIIISCKTGQTTVIRGVWPPGYYDLLKHSTTAEPLAVAMVTNTFFEPYAAAKVVLVSDNTPTVGEVNKGYGTKEGRFIAHHLKTRFPYLEIDAEYYPGEVIPTDEGSRGLATDRKKLDAFAESKALTIGEIREIVV